jgi:hypothetical protein
VLLTGCGGSGTESATGGATAATSAGGSRSQRPLKLEVKASRRHLPAPLSGEAIVPQGKELLVIGGLDESDVSVATVTRLDPATGASKSAGELSQPLHDIAAAEVPSGVLVFGGGSVTTTAEVQRLTPGGIGEAVGELPVPRSDLSVVRVGDAAYVLAGYDGEQAVGEVLRTRDGSQLETVGKLPVPVRYAAVFALGPTIYAVGGEETSGADTTAIQAFETKSGRTSVVGHLAAPLAHASAVVLGGRVYVLGGRLNDLTSDQILLFDPAARTAKRAGRLPEPIQNAAAATVGDVGYLVGGLGSDESTLSTVVTIRLNGR